MIEICGHPGNMRGEASAKKCNRLLKQAGRPKAALLVLDLPGCFICCLLLCLLLIYSLLFGG